jgi:5-methylcytosine-specific restriction protein A
MARGIPDGISRKDILAAIEELDRGAPHRFADSTGYDVLYNDKRYPPKAIVGLAAEKLTGSRFGPYDFRGGLGTKCFAILEGAGFTIIPKSAANLYPDEVSQNQAHVEGAIQTIQVNRYERDPSAREECIKHFGATCQVCQIDFSHAYGALGEGFIHVHHLVPLSDIAAQYVVNPITDLIPVCPNCHAMIHRRTPPFSVIELRAIIRAQKPKSAKIIPRAHSISPGD